MDGRRLRYWSIVAALGLALALPVAEASAVPLSLTVNQSGDADDLDAPAGPWDTICDSSAAAGIQCTLRAAIRTTSNNNNVGEIDTVSFSVPGNVITANTSLPNSGEPVTFNGCASLAATAPCTDLHGTSLASNGFTVVGPTVTVRGLAISGFNAGIAVSSTGDGLVVENTWLGLRLDGSGSATSTGIGLGGDEARIGGDSPSEGNVFANSAAGIVITGDDNTVTGNRFGVNAAGVSRPNAGGIHIETQGMNVPQGNEIGSDDSSGQNQISNSTGLAIRIVGDGVDSNEILRNFGTNNAGLFIDLGVFGPGNGLMGPNTGIEAPAVGSATTALVSGSSVPLAHVRVFRGGSAPGTIDGFAGEASADGAGNWSAPVSGVAAGDQLRATQTGPGGNTSEFSEAATAVVPPANTPPTVAVPPAANPQCAALRKQLKKAKKKKRKRKLRKKLRALGC